jgi:DNA-binding Lrp family transcriptional regulator
MEEQGVLREAVRLVDPKKVGRGVNVMCQARLKSHSPEHRKAFEQFMQAHEEIMECYSMSGEWDYLMRIVVGDVGEYERFLMKDLLGHPSVATEVHDGDSDVMRAPRPGVHRLGAIGAPALCRNAAFNLRYIIQTRK